MLFRLLPLLAIFCVFTGAGPDKASAPVPLKKGACVASKKPGWEKKVESLKVSWHYTWGTRLPAKDPASVVFVPMIWGYGSDGKFEQSLAEILEQKKSGCLRISSVPDVSRVFFGADTVFSLYHTNRSSCRSQRHACVDPNW